MLLTSPLSSPLKNPVRDVFSPAGGSPSLTAQVQALFAGGKVGGMWDMGDTSTLFQNTAGQDMVGTTLASSVGNPVGMVLDKSQGLVYGPQLVTNGDFSSGASWTLDSGWSISGGQLVGTTVAHANSATQSIPSLSANDFHEVTFTVNVASGALIVNLGNLGVTSTELYVSSSGTYTYLTPKVGPSQIVFWAFGSFTGTIDYVSVREIPGNHATQPTAGWRPLYQVDGGYGCAQFDGTNDALLFPAITFGGAFNTFVASKVTGGTSGIHLWRTADVNGTWAKYKSGDATTPTGTGSGSPTYAVNGTALSPSQQGQLYTQINGVDSVVESIGVVLTAETALQLSGFVGSLFTGNAHRVLMISGTLTAAEKLLCRRWAAEGNGVAVV